MSCSHLTTTPHTFTPNTKELVCPDCVQEGRKDWVQLRICVECGHVGCCDSSPGRHATKHYEGTQHPVMQSFMPSQTWQWCYIDEEMSDPGVKLY